MTEQLVSVKDVEDTLAGLTPGETYRATTLYQRYVLTMSRQERDPQHPTSFGHALAAYGAERVRIRKRIGGKPTEHAGWRLPGVTEPTEDVVAATVRLFQQEPGFRGAFIPEDELYERYLRLCSSQHWGAPMARARFMAGLTRLGRTRHQDKRRWCRAIPPLT